MEEETGNGPVGRAEAVVLVEKAGRSRTGVCPPRLWVLEEVLEVAVEVEDSNSMAVQTAGKAPLAAEDRGGEVAVVAEASSRGHGRDSRQAGGVLVGHKEKSHEDHEDHGGGGGGDGGGGDGLP